eukprot:12137670-Heterocapsa_arctica.AAC.1
MIATGDTGHGLMPKYFVRPAITSTLIHQLHSICIISAVHSYLAISWVTANLIDPYIPLDG